MLKVHSRGISRSQSSKVQLEINCEKRPFRGNDLHKNGVRQSQSPKVFVASCSHALHDYFVALLNESSEGIVAS